MIPFEKYIIWRCNKCKNWQIKQNNKWTINMSEEGKSDAIHKLHLRCMFCTKPVKFKHLDHIEPNVNHYWCTHPKNAREMIWVLKKNEAELDKKLNQDYDGDFKSKSLEE